MYGRLSIQKHTGKFLTHPSRYYFTLYFASDSSLRRAVTKKAIPATNDAAPTIPGSEFLVCSVLAAVRGLWSDCPDRCFCHSTFSGLTLTGPIAAPALGRSMVPNRGFGNSWKRGRPSTWSLAEQRDR